MKLSPVVIFGYDRPVHLKKMIESLSLNPETSNTDAFIFVDGINDSTNKKNHQLVVDIASSELPFKKVSTVIRDKNFGCKKNIISGITEVFYNYDSAIILEDDLIFGEHFLNYMNNALNYYKNNNQIWHINGYAHPQILRRNKRASISSLAQPWGWATWSDRWRIFIEGKYYEKNIISTLSLKERKKYNFYNLATYWEDALKLDQINKNSIWDAYWYQTIFLKNGLTVFPQLSHVFNNGFDGSGLHCGVNNQFDTKLNFKKTEIFPSKLKVSYLYKINTYIFYKKIKIYDYFSFHKSKFSSLKNFINWVKSKLTF